MSDLNGSCRPPYKSTMLSQTDIKELTRYRSDLQKISYEGTFYLASVIAAFHTKVLFKVAFFTAIKVSVVEQCLLFNLPQLQ